MTSPDPRTKKTKKRTLTKGDAVHLKPDGRLIFIFFSSCFFLIVQIFEESKSVFIPPRGAICDLFTKNVKGRQEETAATPPPPRHLPSLSRFLACVVLGSAEWIFLRGWQLREAQH